MARRGAVVAAAWHEVVEGVVRKAASDPALSSLQSWIMGPGMYFRKSHE